MEIITQERFCKNINLMNLAFVSGNEDIILRIFKGILAHFPNEKESLEHYCFVLNFGKCGDEYEPPEEFYERLIKSQNSKI
ncbi:hypothetical protein [Flavobacterium sp.]|uniref:hypothetical protein n=1 Tax=Flavobacterium sp. TaxID=239 RepID=UPI0038FCE89A